MTLYSKTRKLVSTTGYIKSLVDNTVYDHAIYLGIYDAKENYLEATEEEFNQYIQEQEAAAQAL